jgi:hypothetical protein
MIKAEKLRCTSCKRKKDATQFPGWKNGRPGYHCVECSADDRVRTKYRKEIASEPIEVSEGKLFRKRFLADMFEQELERYRQIHSLPATNPADHTDSSL